MAKEDAKNPNGAADDNHSPAMPAAPSAASSTDDRRKRKGLTPEEQALMEHEKNSKKNKGATAASKNPKKKAKHCNDNKGESSGAVSAQVTRPMTGQGTNGNNMIGNNMLPPFAGGNPMMVFPRPANMIPVQMQMQMNMNMNRMNMMRFMNANANMKMTNTNNINNNSNGSKPTIAGATTPGVPQTTTTSKTTTANNSLATTNGSADTIQCLRQQLIETQKTLALIKKNAVSEAKQKYEKALAKEKEKRKQQSLTIQRLKDQLKQERQAHAETKQKIKQVKNFQFNRLTALQRPSQKKLFLDASNSNTNQNNNHNNTGGDDDNNPNDDNAENDNEESDTDSNIVELNRHDLKWEQKFKVLQEFHNKYGHTNVTQASKEEFGTSLWNWVRTQRSQFVSLAQGNRTTLTPYRLAKMRTLGFVWEPNAAVTKYTFEQRLEQLQEFKAVHGHCNVPQHSNSKDNDTDDQQQQATADTAQYIQPEGLGEFVLHCRKMYRLGRLPEVRVKALEALEFQWRLRTLRRDCTSTTSTPQGALNRSIAAASNNNNVNHDGDVDGDDSDDGDGHGHCLSEEGVPEGDRRFCNFLEMINREDTQTNKGIL